MKCTKRWKQMPMQFIRLIGLTGLSVFCGLLLAGCEEKPKPTTRLVYLAPYSPCEAGERGYGEPNCATRRKRDAVMVLRVPLHYATTETERPAVPNGLRGDIVLEPNGEVITGGEPGRLDEWVKKEKAAIRNRYKLDPNEPIFLGGFGFGTNFVYVGHQQARSRMQSYDNTSEKYIEIPSFAPGFKIYDVERCARKVVQYGISGSVNPDTSCDYRSVFVLPEDDENTYLLCTPPTIYQGKFWYIDGCKLNSGFELTKIDGKPFYMVYSYVTSEAQITQGQWKYINQRFKAWIQSIDVTEQELNRSKK